MRRRWRRSSLKNLEVIIAFAAKFDHVAEVERLRLCRARALALQLTIEVPPNEFAGDGGNRI